MDESSDKGQLKTKGTNTDLGTALAILRVIRGWNQEELAKAAGLRAGTISDYERGKMVPGLRTVEKLLEAEGYPFAAVDVALKYIYTLRSESLQSTSSSSLGPNGADRSALAREIDEISTMAGSVASRIIRLALSLLQQRKGASSQRDSAAGDTGEGEQGGEEGA